MKILLVLAVLCLPLASPAQDDESVAAQRARIAAERGQAEAAFRAQEKACYRWFAVNDCLNAAKAERRQVLADLRRQEVSLNDAQRKRKAAEHLRDIEQRSLADNQEQQAQRREKALADQRDREASAAQKAADRATSRASAPAKAADREDEVARRQSEAQAARVRRDEDAARNVKRHELRLAEAENRRASREKRLAERRKPKATPLPAAP